MKILIVSDIHGNLEALQALPTEYDEMWILGDLACSFARIAGARGTGGGWGEVSGMPRGTVRFALRLLRAGLGSLA
jgi:hypothetical protein